MVETVWRCTLTIVDWCAKRHAECTSDHRRHTGMRACVMRCSRIAYPARAPLILITHLLITIAIIIIVSIIISIIIIDIIALSITITIQQTHFIHVVPI